MELANGPVSLEAYQALEAKGVTIIPDILANSGGVYVSYLEWKTNLDNTDLSLEDTVAKLKEVMTGATKKVVTTAGDKKVDLKQAAFMVALKNLVD